MKQFKRGEAVWVLVGLEDAPTRLGMQAKKILVSDVNEERVEFESGTEIHASAFKHSFHTKNECIEAMKAELDTIKD